MKYHIVILILLTIFFSACSKKEESKLTLYGTEAFAYDLGNSWEVNSTTRVKGFLQNEENGFFKASFAYEINLVTPKNDTIKALISKVVDKAEKEKMTDTQLDTQFDLDSTYSNGKYKLVWNVKETMGKNVATSSAEFDLSRE